MTDSDETPRRGERRLRPGERHQTQASFPAAASLLLALRLPELRLVLAASRCLLRRAVRARTQQSVSGAKRRVRFPKELHPAAARQFRLGRGLPASYSRWRLAQVLKQIERARSL